MKTEHLLLFFNIYYVDSLPTSNGCLHITVYEVLTPSSRPVVALKVLSFNSFLLASFQSG